MATRAVDQGGWTALPRITVWLCIPALLSGGAAAAEQLGKAMLSPSDPLRVALLRAATGIAITFSFASFVVTPVAAILVLIISVRRQSSLRVVGLLWLIVLTSSAVTIPALRLTLEDFMILHGSFANPG